LELLEHQLNLLLPRGFLDFSNDIRKGLTGKPSDACVLIHEQVLAVDVEEHEQTLFDLREQVFKEVSQSQKDRLEHFLRIDVDHLNKRDEQQIHERLEAVLLRVPNQSRDHPDQQSGHRFVL